MNVAINESHLTLVEGVVNRLASNSFALKGWSVTLVSALLALASKDTDPRLVIISLLPTLTFWGLDGYFLARERLFRELYAKLVDTEQQVPAYSMRIEPCTIRVWAVAAFSLTLLLFHGTVLAAVIGVLIYAATS